MSNLAGKHTKRIIHLVGHKGTSLLRIVFRDDSYLELTMRSDNPAMVKFPGGSGQSFADSFQRELKTNGVMVTNRGIGFIFHDGSRLDIDAASLGVERD